MARTAKKTQTVRKEDTFSDGDLALEAEKPVVVTERHRVVREWSENKPVDAADVIEDEEDDIESAVEEVVELDPIALVAQEMASSQHNWTLRVDRLPEYETTGKSGVGFRKFCGFLPIPSAEWLRDQCYLEEIQSRWARPGECNSFAICIRKGSIIFRYLPIVSVEPAPNSSLPGINGLPVDANGSTINVYGNPQNPTEAMEAHFALMNKYVGFAQKLNSTFQQPQQPVFQQQPINKKALLFEALVEDDPMLGDVKLLARKFLGEATNDGPNIWSFLSNVINSPMVTGIAQRVLAAQPANGHAQPEAPPQIPLDVQAQQRLLAALTNAMRLNINPEEALPAIDGFLALFPEQRQVIEQLLSAEPAQLLGALPQFFPPAAEVVGLPHAAEWVGKLKAVYFGEGEESEQLK